MSPTYVVAPVIPFQPEELHRQVRELEQVYGQIPALDVHLNGRLAVAMAIVLHRDQKLVEHHFAK